MTDREVAEINVLRAVVRQADAIGVLQAKLDAITAERDALRAKLDAVPVQAISTYFDGSVVIRSARSGETERYRAAETTVGEWLDKVVQP